MRKLASTRAAVLLFFILIARDASGASAPVVALHRAMTHGKGWVTLIDPDTYAVLGTAEVDRPPWPLAFGASGSSLFVVTSVSPGQPTVPTGKKPVTLWSIDARSAASTSIGELGRSPLHYFPDPGFTRLYVADASTKAKTNAISVYDLVARKPLGALASVERLTMVQLSPDGALLYAVCEGKPHKRPKGSPGNLHVLDAMTGAELARLSAGEGASSIAFDTNRGLAYVMGAAGEVGAGQVTVLRGAAVAAQFSVPGRPIGLRFAADGGSYLLAKGAVVSLDAFGLAAAHTWSLTFDPSDLVFDPSHGLMFAGAGLGSEIAEMSMSGGGVMASHPTGSAGRKFGKGVGATVYFIFAVAGAAGGAPGVTPFLMVHNSSTSMTLGPDSAILYVLNPYTNDVSLFDIVKQDVVDIVHTGGGSLRIVQLHGDPNFWVQSRENLVRLNTSTNRIDRTIDLQHGVRAAAVGYDMERGRAWIAMNEKVLVADLRTGEVVGNADLPAPAFSIWIDNSRTPVPDGS